MIIKRLATGIKEQDWFVVLVEVMIVVVGIFIGLQVDDWNEGIKERDLEKQYLERILNDFEISIEDHIGDLERMKVKVGMTTKALEMIYDRTLSDDTRVEFEDAFSHIGAWGDLTVITDTLKR